jgi:hypothetical protein
MNTNQFTWHDAATLTIAGKGWPDESRRYERLPRRAKALIPPKPWQQSLHPAGLSVRFATNASMIHARWIDYDGRRALNQHGVNALALYVRWKDRWTWVGTSKQIGKGPDSRLLNDIIPATGKSYLLYLPARGVRRLEIGIPRGAWIKPSKPPRSKPIVFYGTSIVQAGGASRPGNGHVAMIERHFDCPVINLGFSGSGRMEPEMVRLVSELDARVFVIDCLPNMVAGEVAERFAPAIRILRNDHPRTPIVVVDSVPYEDGFLVKSRRDRYRSSNRVQRTAFLRLQEKGVRGLYYVESDGLIGRDNDATIDGTHPNDLGYRRLADRLIHALRPLVGCG